MPTIAQIETLLASEPDDAFLNYSLAMLLAKERRRAEAIARFDHLLELDPNYIAGWFQKGIYLAGLGETAAARATLERGIERAGAIGDAHARGEMAEFLATL